MAANSSYRIRTSDFAQPGWHTKPTGAYQLFFEFLRLSPSYQMARVAAQRPLTDAEKVSLPHDFDRVLATYKLLGNVQRVLFGYWWRTRGLKVFGNPYSRPRVHKIAVLDGGRDFTAEQLQPVIEGYLYNTRIDEGMVGSVLVSVPLGLRKGEIERQLEQILANIPAQQSPAIPKSVLKLHGERFRGTVLINGLRLMWFKAARPQFEHWRLGALARFSKTYSSVLNPTDPRHVKDDRERIDREMMTKITDRALRKFETITENAARGLFPCQDPVEQMPFDYRVLKWRIHRKNLWEEQAKAQFEAKSRRKRPTNTTVV